MPDIMQNWPSCILGPDKQQVEALLKSADHDDNNNPLLMANQVGGADMEAMVRTWTDDLKVRKNSW